MFGVFLPEMLGVDVLQKNYFFSNDSLLES